MGTTNVLSSYLMTVDKHRFALMWLVYSRNKFFRVGPNISEEFVPGGTNFRGVQIKRDRTEEGDSALWLLQLALEKPWSAPGEPSFCFLARTNTKMHVNVHVKM